jgi:hypothetical protein
VGEFLEDEVVPVYEVDCGGSLVARYICGRGEWDGGDVTIHEVLGVGHDRFEDQRF